MPWHCHSLATTQSSIFVFTNDSATFHIHIAACRMWRIFAGVCHTITEKCPFSQCDLALTYARFLSIAGNLNALTIHNWMFPNGNIVAIIPINPRTLDLAIVGDILKDGAITRIWVIAFHRVATIKCSTETRMKPTTTYHGKVPKDCLARNKSRQGERRCTKRSILPSG